MIEVLARTRSDRFAGSLPAINWYFTAPVYKASSSAMIDRSTPSRSQTGEYSEASLRSRRKGSRVNCVSINSPPRSKRYISGLDGGCRVRDNDQFSGDESDAFEVIPGIGSWQGEMPPSCPIGQHRHERAGDGAEAVCRVELIESDQAIIGQCGALILRQPVNDRIVR